MNYLTISLIFLFIANSGCAQEYQSKSELEKEILGVWHYENDSRSKIAFSDDGILKRYFGDELQSTGTYEITNSCEGEELPDKQFFLLEHNEYGSSSCAYIEAINLTKGLFTLMTKSQGKVIVLKRNNL